MSKQSLLLVDGDTRSLRVLEVSLRKVGFTVTTAETVHDALEKLEVHAPDLIVSETTFPDGDGFELRRRVRATPDWGEIPFIFLTAEQAIENKIRGLELGVDDYLTKPIYIKEIITRINILLQKRQRTRFEERRDGRTRFAGRVADMPVVDIIQTIEISRKSGVIQFVGDRGKQATIYFRDGRVIDAEAGALQGEDAVYRLLTWNDGEFEVIFRTVRRREVIQTSSQGLLMEGMRRLDEWSRILEQLPSLSHRFEVDTLELAARLGEVPDDNNRILRLIDGRRTLYEVIDASDVGDLECLQAIARLYFEEILLDLDHKPNERKRDTGQQRVATDETVPTPIEEVASGPVTAAHLNRIEEDARREASGPKEIPPPPDAIIPGLDDSMPIMVPGSRETVPTDLTDVISEESAPGPLGGSYRPSSLRLIDEAVAAAQAIEPWALIAGLDIEPAGASRDDIDAGWGAPSAPIEPLAIEIPVKPATPKSLLDDLPVIPSLPAKPKNGHTPVVELEAHNEFESESSTITEPAITENSVPTMIEVDEASGPPQPQPKPRPKTRQIPTGPVEDVTPLKRDDSGLRMIGSLGRDRAQASGELRPSQIMKSEPEPETQREMITILPRRITREIPLLNADGTSPATDPATPAVARTVTPPADTPITPAESAEPPITPAATATATAVDEEPRRVDEPQHEEPRRIAEPRMIAEPMPTERPRSYRTYLVGLIIGIVVVAVIVKTRKHAPVVTPIDAAVGSIPTTNPPPIVDAALVTPTPDAAVAATPIDAPAPAIDAPIVVDAAVATAPADANTTDLARHLADQAHDAIEENDYAKALELMEQSLKLRKTARSYLQKATALQRLGRGDEAIDAIDLAIDIYKHQGGSPAAAYEQKGRILWSQGHRDDAREAFEKYLELEPNSPRAAQIRKQIGEPR